MSNVVSVRLTEAVEQEIERRAAAANLTKSAMAAQLIEQQLAAGTQVKDAMQEQDPLITGALPPNLALLLVETAARVVAVQNHLQADVSRLEAVRQFLIRQYLK